MSFTSGIESRRWFSSKEQDAITADLRASREMCELQDPVERQVAFDGYETYLRTLTPQQALSVHSTVHSELTNDPGWADRFYSGEKVHPEIRSITDRVFSTVTVAKAKAIEAGKNCKFSFSGKELAASMFLGHYPDQESVTK